MVTVPDGAALTAVGLLDAEFWLVELIEHPPSTMRRHVRPMTTRVVGSLPLDKVLEPAVHRHDP
jgi:hypothetical protein